MVILILSTGMRVDTKDVVILILGGVITVAWFVLGMWTVRASWHWERQNKKEKPNQKQKSPPNSFKVYQTEFSREWDIQRKHEN